MMGTKSLRNEESSGEIFVLEFDLVMKSFVWKKIPLVIPSRGHHSTMLSNDHLYVFCGIDYVSNARRSLIPIVVSTETWDIVQCILCSEFPE